MTRAVLAPDKFKGTLTAAEVAGHLADGLRGERPDVEVVIAAVSDGGDGLLAVFAEWNRVPVVADDARGVPTATAFVRSGDDAVIELAAVAGLAALADPIPMTATSRGVGEVLVAALDAGCSRILLGIGGSASTDGGVGMLQALGARVVDVEGADVSPGGFGAEAADTLDLTALHPALSAATIEVACDVDNPLTGPDGAAAVFGPQKGADAQQVRRLDRALANWADVVAAATGVDHRDEPGAGAAGGVGFSAVAVLGARLRPGVATVLERIRFAETLRGADLVVTGEGALDAQTVRGKAPAGVAAAARAAGVPVVAVAGRCDLDDAGLASIGIDAAYPLTAEADTPDEAFNDPGPLLRRVGARIARRHLR